MYISGEDLTVNDDFQARVGEKNLSIDFETKKPMKVFRGKNYMIIEGKRWKVEVTDKEKKGVI